MTMETDEKAQSKFPRASLRARNRTMMITPADVDDFQVTTKKKGDREAPASDEADDPLAALDDISMDAHELSSEDASQGSSVAFNEPLDSLDEGLGALSDAFELDTVSEQSVAEPEENSDCVATADDAEAGDIVVSGTVNEESDVLDAKDIFAAPGETAVTNEELFSVPTSDPISRGTRSVHSVLGSLEGRATNGNQNGAERDSWLLSSVHAGNPSEIEVDRLEYKKSRRCDDAREYVDWKRLGKLVGFLVSYVSDPMGGYIELREGRLLVTRGESSSDSCLVICDDSVSPMHAIIRISADGSILILDQLSEQGTRIRRADSGKVESLMGDKSSLCHGDVVIFGECEYHVVVMGAAALHKDEK